MIKRNNYLMKSLSKNMQHSGAVNQRGVQLDTVINLAKYFMLVAKYNTKSKVSFKLKEVYLLSNV